MIGKVVKGVGGFYYVSDGKNVIMGNARGILKRHKDVLVVGDLVEYEIRKEDGDCIITRVLPRKNKLPRPPVSNLDALVIVFAAAHPKVNFYAVDRMCAVCECYGLDVMIAVTKTDLADDDEIRDLIAPYKDVYPVYPVSSRSGIGIGALRRGLEGKSTALAGPSGVGKSTLLNKLLGRESAETGDISEKTQRGKHTTRHVEIFSLDPDTYVYDTPGFTSLDLPKDVDLMKLRTLFREFRTFDVECRYGDCMHINEPDCGVKQAVEDGKIHQSRYQSYLNMYDEVKKCQR